MNSVKTAGKLTYDRTDDGNGRDRIRVQFGPNEADSERCRPEKRGQRRAARMGRYRKRVSKLAQRTSESPRSSIMLLVNDRDMTRRVSATGIGHISRCQLPRLSATITLCHCGNVFSTAGNGLGLRSAGHPAGRYPGMRSISGSRTTPAVKENGASSGLPPSPGSSH